MPPAKVFLYEIVLFITLAHLCTVSAYYVNARRPTDDPKKRKYHPLAVLFAPVTLPILMVSFITFYILRALVYGMFLVLFVVALIFVREPVVLAKIQKEATSIGTILLDVNTALIRLFLKPLVGNPKAT